MGINKRKHLVLNKIYSNYNSTSGLGSKYKLYKKAREIKQDITFKDVSDFLSGNETYTLHKPVRHRYSVNKIISPSVDTYWESDLSDVSNIRVHNDQINFLLFIIDVYSRHLIVKPIIDKKGKTVADAIHDIFIENNRIPAYLRSDKGSEFLAKEVQKLLHDYGVGFIKATSKSKASIVERVQRTIKEKMYKYFTMFNTYRYVDVLDDFVNAYNSSVHRTICRTPNDVIKNNKKPCNINKLNNNNIKIKKNKLLEIGDHVRISKTKKHFAKGYEKGWTIEVFVVKKILCKNKIPMYIIHDLLGEEVEGSFYKEELQKMSFDKNKPFKIEKILKIYKKKGKSFAKVRWEGYPPKFDSEIEYNKKSMHLIKNN